MNYNEYLKEVNKTWMKQSEEQEFIHCELSLVEEIGEIIGVYKKHFGYGKAKDEKWYTKLIEECGDLIYYITKTADVYQFDITDQYSEDYHRLIEAYDFNKPKIAKKHLSVMSANALNIVDDELCNGDKICALISIMNHFLIMIKSEGLTLEQIQRANVAKLQTIRHKNGFNKESIMDEGRDKKAELEAVKKS